MRLSSILLSAILALSATTSALPQDLDENFETNPRLPHPVSILSNGQSCNDDRSCQSGICKNSVCAADRGCKVNGDCGPAGLCNPDSHQGIDGFLTGGRQCSYAEQCRSGHCSNGKCEDAPGAFGAHCEVHEQCNGDYVCRYVQFARESEKVCWNYEPGSWAKPCRPHSDDCGSGRCEDRSGVNTISKIFRGPPENPENSFFC